MDPLTAEIVAAALWFFVGGAAVSVIAWTWFVVVGAIGAAAEKAWVLALAIIGAWGIPIAGSIFVIIQVFIHAAAALQMIL